MRALKFLVVAFALAAQSHALPLVGGGDDTCQGANAVGPGLFTGFFTYGSWLPTVDITHDWDWYRFTVLPGQRMDVDALITGTSPNPPVGWYTFTQLYNYDAVSCVGSVVENSFQNHVSVVNTTTAAKDYVVSYYAGVTNVNNAVSVYYDLLVQATTVSNGVSYCPGSPNSLGLSGTLSVQGTNSVSANDMVFVGTNLPANTFALLASGTAQTNIPFGDGRRCIAGTLRRLYQLPASSGTWTAALDIPNLPPGSAIVAGDVRYFQLYYRDLFGPLGTGFNLTNGMCVGFTP